MYVETSQLQLAGPLEVTIYSRPGCHLCEEAKAQIAPLLKEFGARLTEINIDEDPAIRAEYDYDIPVIFLGARKAAKHRVDLAQFRRQLRNLIDRAFSGTGFPVPLQPTFIDLNDLNTAIRIEER